MNEIYTNVFLCQSLYTIMLMSVLVPARVFWIGLAFVVKVIVAVMTSIKVIALVTNTAVISCMLLPNKCRLKMKKRTQIEIACMRILSVGTTNDMLASYLLYVRNYKISLWRLFSPYYSLQLQTNYALQIVHSTARMPHPTNSMRLYLHSRFPPSHRFKSMSAEAESFKESLSRAYQKQRIPASIFQVISRAAIRTSHLDACHTLQKASSVAKLVQS